ncbi:MAG: gamma-glutamyltransferase [Desulfarculaceae bacterium]
MAKHFDTHRPLLMGTSWMITADHPLAAQAGASILEAGGNAVDAAIAANLVLTVVRPHMCGPGGDLFALIYMAESGELTALNASGRAPSRASIEFYKNQGYDAVPLAGILTATVPGTISGWQAALDKYGTMTLEQLLPRAIAYAENGFPVYSDLRLAMEQRRPLLMKSPAAARTFFPGGETPAIGDLLVQPLLARTYRTLATQGPDAFYRGELGRALVNFSDAEGGLFSEEDLAGHTCNWVEPLRTGYRGYEICTHPPNSQGIALLMQVNILETFDLAAMGPNQAELIHLMVEAKKLAFADRDQYVCDPDVNPVPIKELLDKGQARAQAQRIDPDSAASSPEPRRFTSGGDDTVYLAVVDSQGNAVSLIQSIYQAFGSCVMVPETGMLLHNRGCGFSLDPGHVNALAPGKRPYHTLHPAMILQNEKPCIVLGTPGADGQTQTIIQITTSLLDFGADVQQAMEAPRWRSDSDGALLMEGRFPPEAVAALKAKGHQVQVLPEWDEVMGSSQAIFVDQERGMLMGGADPRRQAYAIAK